jgi:hypothetical protein
MAEHQIACIRAHAIGTDYEVEALRLAVCELNVDTVAILLETANRDSEPKSYLVFDDVVHQAAKITPHNLILGREVLYPLSGLVNPEKSTPSVRPIDDGKALLGHRLGTERFLEAHTLHNCHAVASEIDLQASRAEAGEAFDDGDVVAELGEPKGEGIASNAGAAYEDLHWGHSEFGGLMKVMDR